MSTSTPNMSIDTSEARVRELLNTLQDQLHSAGLPTDAATQLRQEVQKLSHAQQQMHEDRDRLELALEAGQAGTVQWDMRANKACWNPNAYRIHGYEPGFFEPTYDFWLSQLHPDDRQRVATQFATCLSERRSDVVCEYRILRPTGEVRWVRGVGRFRFGADQVAEFFTGIAVDVTEEVQTQEALARSKAELQEAQRLAHVGSRTWDVDSDTNTWSEELYRIFGRDPKMPSLHHAEHSALYTPESWSRLKPAEEEALRSGTAYELDLEVIRPDETTRWIVTHCEAMRDANGRVIQLRSTVQDITERKQTEQALRENDATLRRLKDANIIGIVQGEEQQIVDANDIFLRMVDYSREDLEAKRLVYSQMTPPEYAPLDEQGMRDLRNAGAANPFEKEYWRKDGSRVPVLLGAARLGDTPLRWIAFVMDLSERKRAEAERQKMATLVQNSRDFIGMANFDGTTIFLNPGGRRLVGLGMDEPVPSVADFLFPEGSSFYEQEVFPTLMHDGRWAGEYTFRHFQTHEPISVLWDCFTVNDPKTGKPLCIATVTRDIREQKRAQEATLQSKELVEQASRAKDQFIASLSHELRTPLTPVLAAVQILERDPSLSPEHLETVQMVQRNVELETRLIDDLLDVTRISRGKLELHMGLVDLHSLLGRVLAICDSDARSAQLRVTMELNAVHHHVQGDTARLQQMFWNLLKNAIKFTPAGGSITIRTSQPAEDRIAISVSDTGVGIEPELLPRIFDVFEQGGQGTTRHFGGLGLGLAISKGIVDLHGGTLTVDSAGKGQGATLTVELRTSAAKPASSEDVPIQTKKSGHRIGRLLLVEDHPDTRNLMAKVLRKEGYQVQTADSVATSLRLATTEDFDLLLCDIGLPDGTGLDLMRQLISNNRPIKAIALSGFGMEDDIARSKEAGFLAHLTKPIDLNLLDETLDRIMAG